MTKKTTAFEEAAERYVVHVSENIYACPACGEQTLWKAATADFLAGAAFERGRILELIRSLSAAGCVHADWLESRFKKGDV